MAISSPEPRFWRTVLTVVAAGMLALSQPLGAQTGVSSLLQPEAPITLDAESSEFDYVTSRLVFYRLRLEQGALGVVADMAETARLDFTDGEWLFSGNVKITAPTAQLHCDQALLVFRNHQLIRAELRGKPARFTQIRADGQDSGEANLIVYELIDGILRLSGGARFTDGANEISGDIITYDMTAGKLTAGSGDGGPVRIYIEPPSLRGAGEPGS